MATVVLVLATAVPWFWRLAPVSARTESSWPSLQGGPAHPGAISSAALAPALRSEWRATGPDGEGRMSPAVLVGDLAISTSPTAVVAFDPATGAARWSVPRDASPIDPAAVAPDLGSHGILVYGEGNRAGASALVAIDLDTREELWRVELKEPARGAPSIADGVVFVGTRDDSVVAVDANTGTLAWTAKTSGEVDTSPAVAGGRVFAAAQNRSTGESRLYALDERSGKTLWTYAPAGISFGVTSPTVAGDAVYMGFGDQFARRLDAASGAVRWQGAVRDAFSPLATPAVAGDSVYFVDRAGGVFRFRAADGTRVWDYQLPAPAIQGSPLAVDGTVYAGSRDGTLAAIDGESGHLVWETNMRAGGIGSLTPAGDLLLVPVIDRHGGIVAFRHDPGEHLIDRSSPTHVNLAVALGNFAAAFLLVLLGLLGVFHMIARLQPSLAEPVPAGTNLGQADGREGDQPPDRDRDEP